MILLNVVIIGALLGSGHADARRSARTTTTTTAATTASVRITTTTSSAAKSATTAKLGRSRNVGSASLSCRDLSGQPVDWYTGIKLPKITTNPSWSSLRSGAALVYQDVNNPGKWTRSSPLITDTDSFVATTLAPMYAGNSSIYYVMYNDQPPPNRDNQLRNGHAKGLIFFDSKSLIWLIHSVPGFPPQASNNGAYGFPSSGHLYGQSLMCLSLPITELGSVSTQLYFNNVYVYDQNIPASVSNTNPYLRLLLSGDSRNVPSPFKSTLSITTWGGNQFTSFAKDGRFGQDLYDVDVAPYLQTGLQVEAWRNGMGNIPSDCQGDYSVMNVNAIHFNAPAELDVDIQWITNDDHSKWAVSASNTTPWTCVGDINRQSGQFRRGGGTVCLKHSQVWTSYNDLIAGVDPCDNSGRNIDSQNRTRSAHRRLGSKQQFETTGEIDFEKLVITANADLPVSQKKSQMVPLINELGF